jgi:hypothetical protein
VEKGMLLEFYSLQETYTEKAVSTYVGAIDGWLISVGVQPRLPLPPIPQLPWLIPPTVELLFGSCAIDAPLVIACPPLALRLLRQALVTPGDPNEYTPYPRPQAQPVDNRVVGDENPANPGYFRPGPADHFPNHYVYTLNGTSYVKFCSPFGATWMLLSN